jgi:hypothetical protein
MADSQELVPVQDHFSLENKGSVAPLEPVAMAALKSGKMLMEAGARAKSIERIVE